MPPAAAAAIATMASFSIRLPRVKTMGLVVFSSIKANSSR